MLEAMFVRSDDLATFYRMPLDDVRRGVRDQRNGKPIHTVYWLYDEDDELLYVGATNRVAARMYYHRRCQPWGGRIFGMFGEEYIDRAEAEAMERDAIARHEPLHNVAHRAKKEATR